jgi:hypothetical protein
MAVIEAYPVISFWTRTILLKRKQIIAAWLITFHTHYDLTVQLNICILVLQVVIVFSGPWLCLDM